MISVIELMILSTHVPTDNSTNTESIFNSMRHPMALNEVE